jgi:hypothetical protein
MNRRELTSSLVVALVLAAGTASAQSQSNLTLANAGTLTCTANETPAESKADAELSCAFKAPSGEDGNFKGFIARSGDAHLPLGGRVLVWSVLAPTVDVNPHALVGTYAGESGGQLSGRLVGGEKNEIILQPTTVTSQLGDKPAPAVLRLRIEPVRA